MRPEAKEMNETFNERYTNKSILKSTLCSVIFDTWLNSSSA